MRQLLAGMEAPLVSLVLETNTPPLMREAAMRTLSLQQPRPCCGLSCRNPATTSSSSLSFNYYKNKNRRASTTSFAVRGASSGEVQVTMSDSELASRGFAVRRTVEGLDVRALNEVFARVGFPRRQEERLRRALEHSRVVWLSATAGEEKERPVAFARASGDGVFNAVVWDVVVEPSCQGLGLGRAVMERLVHDLRRDGVSNIVLYAEPRVVGFYRLLDFAMDPDGIRGMAYYRKSSRAAAATN